MSWRWDGESKAFLPIASKCERHHAESEVVSAELPSQASLVRAIVVDSASVLDAGHELLQQDAGPD